MGTRTSKTTSLFPIHRCSQKPFFQICILLGWRPKGLKLTTSPSLCPAGRYRSSVTLQVKGSGSVFAKFKGLFRNSRLLKRFKPILELQFQPPFVEPFALRPSCMPAQYRRVRRVASTGDLPWSPMKLATRCYPREAIGVLCLLF